MGKNKNKHNKPENPRLAYNIAKIGNSDKSKIYLEKLNDQLNLKNLNSDQITEIIKIANLNGQKTSLNQTQSKKTHSEAKKSVSSEVESGELDQTMADSSELFSFYANPLKKNNTQKIPAIKFKIAADISDKFKNQVELTKEINRCHQHLNKRAIKFVSLKGNLIIIATDDQDTYDLLSSNWPNDAFLKGIRMLEKNVQNKSSNKTLIIKGVHPSIDINDQEIAEQLKKQGLINVSRIISKSKQTTSLLKAEAIDQDTYKACLLNKIKIGYIRCHTEPLRTVLQCFKCQKVGHTHFNCKSETVCPKCSGNHSLKECLVDNQVKCINCGGDHFACARKCPFLKEAAKTKQIPNPATKNRVPSFRTYAQVARGEQIVAQSTQPIEVRPIESKIEEIVSKKLNDIIEKLLPSLIESVISKLLSNPRLAGYFATNSTDYLNVSPYTKRGDDSIPATPRYNQKVSSKTHQHLQTETGDESIKNQNKRNNRNKYE